MDAFDGRGMSSTVGHAVRVVARTGTILFTDLVGSTALRTALGDEAFDEQRRRHDRLLAGAIERYRGELVKHEGDGVMAMFGSAADAIGCAASMQRAVDRTLGGPEARFVMRVGVSAGDVSEEQGDYHGTPVVEAARLCAAAQGGEILVSDVVRVLAGTRGTHELTSVGALELKGLGEPLVVWQVAWSADADAGASGLPA
ncbi:MAG: adenylate/guanylate cyclase domain-containing protein, partial [Acidimicrobiia bacterium]